MLHATERAPAPASTPLVAPVIAGIFDSEEAASTAVVRLIAAGFDPSHDISVIAAHRREHAAVDVPYTVPVRPGAEIGLTVGAILGAAGSLALTAGLVAGPLSLVAAGPIVAALNGAAAGGLGGGVMGALVGLGLWRREADFDSVQVHGGVVWVGVSAKGARARHAEQVLRDAGARHFHRA